MIIEKKIAKRTECLLGSLAEGDIFEFCEDVGIWFLVSHEKNGDVCIFNLTKNYIDVCSADFDVYPMDATLTVEYKYENNA